MAKYKTLTRNIEIKKTPRLYRMRVKMVEKIKPNGKRDYKRRTEKQNLSRKWDE